jgi:hypothetical protein
MVCFVSVVCTRGVVDVERGVVDFAALGVSVYLFAMVFACASVLSHLF